MDILCARHGNTFGPGDRVVFVGANEDVPLTETGEAQARAVAAALNDSNVAPIVIYSGTLRRQWRYAELIAAELARRPVPMLDSGLTEIDYGDWAGRTNDEIAALPDQAAALKDWNARNAWPAKAHWSRAEDLQRGIADFLGLLYDSQPDVLPPDSTVVLVGSNGVLRILAAMAMGEGAAQHPQFPFKMRTGNVGKLRERGGRYELLYWDVAPGSAPL